MSVIVSLVCLFIFQWLGGVLVQALSLPVPAALVGMVMLLVLLVARGAVPVRLLEGSRFLLAHFMLLFVPAVAGIVVYLEPLQGQWIAIVLSCLAASVLSLWVAAVVFNWALRFVRDPRQ
ncbi:MAG: CidA/LrgA family protein [Alcaligenaceae bacterium]|nr:CidA/LrgA family protein [Alcaligenaceae bacterium]